MNVFTFSGYMGKDPETRVTPSGRTVTNFSVAVKAGYGEHESTAWINCSLWGRNDAEHPLVQYLRTGSFVIVSGELSVREWENQNGKGTAVECKVNDINSPKALNDLGPQMPNQDTPQAEFGPHNSDLPDDDIPF